MSTTQPAAVRVQPPYARSVAVVVYGSGECTYCSILTRHLLRAGITFVEIDCDRDTRARELASSLGGVGGVPVVVFPDGTALATRLLREIRSRLQALGLLDEEGCFPHVAPHSLAPLLSTRPGHVPTPPSEAPAEGGVSSPGADVSEAAGSPPTGEGAHTL